MNRLLIACIVSLTVFALGFMYFDSHREANSEFAGKYRQQAEQSQAEANGLKVEIDTRSTELQRVIELNRGISETCEKLGKEVERLREALAVEPDEDVIHVPKGRAIYVQVSEAERNSLPLEIIFRNEHQSDFSRPTNFDMRRYYGLRQHMVFPSDADKPGVLSGYLIPYKFLTVHRDAFRGTGWRPLDKALPKHEFESLPQYKD